MYRAKKVNSFFQKAYVNFLPQLLWELHELGGY